MPGLESIIGCPDLHLTDIHWDKGREAPVLKAHASQRPCCPRCEFTHVRVKASFNRLLKHSRQGNRIVRVQIRARKFLCLQCGRYFNERFAGILPRKRATETFRLEVFERHEGGVSQRALSQTHELSPATIERWYRDFIAYRVKELSNRPSPRVLGIDEHFFSKKNGFATTFCDLSNHKIYDVTLGRSELSLQPYLKRIPERHRTKVVVMDLSETYRQIAKKHFPNALIVADRFHVIRLVNHQFLRAWGLLDPDGRKNRGLLSLMRRHEQNLSDAQRRSLAGYLSTYPVLKEIYAFKQRLCHILCTKNVTQISARPIVYDFYEMIVQLKATTLEPLRTLGHTLYSWRNEIARMFRFTKTNGITEGFHNKMEMLSRRAFGFRNFENYRMRVLALCGWNGVFNRVV
ncbi:MAG TPA: ISL3 family transposase [Bdellovibrionales bacterium]|nr:ISL3 family transposase [Bdellovibrionales bacterium]